MSLALELEASIETVTVYVMLLPSAAVTV